MINASSATDLLADVPIGDIGLAGLVTLFVFLIFTGRLIPRSTYDQQRADLLAQVDAERQAKEAARDVVMKLMGANGDQAATIRDLVPAARVGVRVGEEVQRLASTNGGVDVSTGGGDHVPPP
jgi:hypothetical protein